MTFDQEFLGMTPELEIILAEGAGMEPGYSSDKVCFLGKPSFKKRNFMKNFHRGGGGGQSVFILLFRNGPKWPKWSKNVPNNLNI